MGKLWPNFMIHAPAILAGLHPEPAYLPFIHASAVIIVMDIFFSKYFNQLSPLLFDGVIKTIHTLFFCNYASISLQKVIFNQKVIFKIIKFPFIVKKNSLFFKGLYPPAHPCPQNLNLGFRSPHKFLLTR